MHKSQQINKNQHQSQNQNPPQQQVPKQATWYDRVLAEQTAIINGISAQPATKQWLITTLTAQFNILFPICHVQGHDASNCFINAQMYSKTRSHPEYQLAWWMVKQLGK